MTDKLQVVCGHCDSIVAAPSERLAEGPRCPNCHQPLFAGAPIELTAGNFDKHVTRNDLPVVVDFWAPWCGPCIAMAPHYEAVAQTLGSKLRFTKLNTQDEPGPAQRFGIRGIPTLIVFKGGQPAVRHTGAMDRAGLARLLEPLG
jgi:thioredoxin 2